MLLPCDQIFFLEKNSGYCPPCSLDMCRAVVGSDVGAGDAKMYKRQTLVNLRGVDILRIPGL